MFIYLISVIRKVIGVRLDNIVGVQYGIAKRIYTEKSGTVGDTNRRIKYYVDVEFPEEQSSIERIRYL